MANRTDGRRAPRARRGRAVAAGAGVDRAIAAARLADPDRPVELVVGLDPSLRGELGLALWRPGDARPVEWYVGRCFDQRTTQWLGTRAAKALGPGGPRAILAYESTAYGARAVTALARCVGSIEGLLVDLGAAVAWSSVPVPANIWRPDAGIPAKGPSDLDAPARRVWLKARAIEAMQAVDHRAHAISHDGAEACFVARCVADRLAGGAA